MSFCAIHLRAMEPEDIDAIYRWENDPSVWIDSAAHQPFSRHALSQFIEENSRADIYSCRQLRLMAEKIDAHVQMLHARGGTHAPVEPGRGAPAVGCVDLFDFEPYHRRAGVGIIVDSQYRRQGIGLAILSALENFAREHLQLHQLHCTIAANNIASIALFEKAGYQRCGTMKEWVFARVQMLHARGGTQAPVELGTGAPAVFGDAGAPAVFGDADNTHWINAHIFQKIIQR